MTANHLLQQQFSERLSNETRAAIASAIWGKMQEPLARVGRENQKDLEENRTSKLEAFFKHYGHTTIRFIGVRNHGRLQTHQDLLFFIELLKLNPTLTRRNLTEYCRGLVEHDNNKPEGQITEGRGGQAAHGQAPTEQPPPGQHIGTVKPPTITRPPSLTQGLRMNPNDPLRLDIDYALSLAVQTLLSMNINPSPVRDNTRTGQSNLFWRNDSSLCEFIEQTIPSYTLSRGEASSPIKASRLKARYLENHVGVQLKWTHHLPDHLKLDIGENSKVLHVFELAGFLEVTYETMREGVSDNDLEKRAKLKPEASLAFGCYPPALLYETMKTIQMLFPIHDRTWLEKKIKKKCIDKRLKAPFEFWYPQDWHPRPLTNRHDLYERYPYWAVRIHTIYEEVEDPTPISWVGRWSERRKAARHTFWLTYLAFIVAILFGIVTTVLGSFQVWIAWCTWSGNGSAACRLGAPGESVSLTTGVVTGTTEARATLRWNA